MSGSGGSGGARGNARRRRRSQEPRSGLEQSTAVEGGVDAWSAYLAQQQQQPGRQLDADLPGPFVQRISAASPTHTDASEFGAPPARKQCIATWLAVCTFGFSFL